MSEFITDQFYFVERDGTAERFLVRYVKELTAYTLTPMQVFEVIEPIEVIANPHTGSTCPIDFMAVTSIGERWHGWPMESQLFQLAWDPDAYDDVKEDDIVSLGLGSVWPRVSER